MVALGARWTLPPTDGSIPFESIIDFHLEHNPGHTWAVLAGIDGAPSISISYEQLAYAVHRAAHIINPGGQVPRGTKIGILVSTDSMVYVALILGVMRAGLVPFPLSPRTQVAGISHLLLSTHTTHLVVGGNPAIDNLWEKVRVLSEAQSSNFSTTQLPACDELYPFLKANNEGSIPIAIFPALSPQTSNALIGIYHSSGSTGVPRSVELDQESIIGSLVQHSVAREFADVGDLVGLMAFPAFHMAGFCLLGVWPLFTGYCPVFLPPSSAPIVPTAEVIMKALISARCVLTVTAPSFLEVWLHDNNAIETLKKLRGVYFGGGPLAEWVGNALASKGIPLRTAYGVTELGCISRFHSPSFDQSDPQNWMYLEFSTQTKCHFVSQEHEGTFELVVVSCAGHKPFVINCEIDGQPAYATKDLMIPHPSILNLWKIIGRLDDQIVLLKGEKVNPGAIEDEIVKSPLVEMAVMFGRERNQAGLLLELAKTAHSKLRSEESRVQLMDEIWPFIDTANRITPTHGRLFRDAVIFADPNRPLSRTPKGTLARAATLKTYANDIDGMYAALERGDKTKGSLATLAPTSTQTQVEEWLKVWLEGLLGTKIDVGVDMFRQGLDSLTATFLFREMKHALGASPAPGHQRAAKALVQETIFRKPTVSQLSELVVQLATTEATTLPKNTQEEEVKLIQQCIQQHDRPWAIQASPIARSPSMEHVVVTGTTGGLGSHLLAQLISHDCVERIWALNRKSSVNGQSVQERQLNSFMDKLLDVDLLRHPKLVLLDCDLTEARLGLRPEVYNDISGTATLVIHNAWQVDFNLSLPSFEPSICGARNLLDLALAADPHPRFVFISSVSAAGFVSVGRQLSEISLAPQDAATSIGYGQSKFVTEKLIESARDSGLETCALRLGQLAGDSTHGAWSLTDWVSSIIASSVSSGYLPDAIGSVSWIPIDLAARSIIEISLNRASLLPPILHCAHPHPTPWRKIIPSFEQALASRTKETHPLPIVPFKEWLSHVNASAAPYGGAINEMAKLFPSTKIQGTIEAMVRGDEELRRTKPEDAESGMEDVEVGGIARLLTTRAASLSSTLKNAPPLDQEDVRKWVGYWAERGLFV
ncbi:acetyl-CoA synthetase-like protein [Ceratobasidium sp. AG-I]|nr:acetyl-CoA synthetase-like protein [Ceratobasidium sp. AG-I]